MPSKIKRKWRNFRPKREMNYYIKLFLLQLKRFIKVIPYTFLGAAVLLSLIGTIAFCASHLLYQDQEITRKEVAVVTSEQDDAYIQFAMNMMENMDSTSLALTFSFYEEDKAYEALEENKVIAVLLFPDNVINGILYGDNYPVTVIFPTGNDLSSVFLTEITKAAGNMLSCAQASIYTTTDLYYGVNMQGSLGEAYEKINLINLSHVLQREKVFLTSSTDLGGAQSTFDYYVASAILLFLLLFGAAFAPVMQRESNAFLSLQKSQHASLIGYLMSRFLSCSVLFFVWQVLFFAALKGLFYQLEITKHFSIKIDDKMLLLLLLFSVLFSAYTNFIYISSKDASFAVLTLFVLGGSLLFLSGAVLPSVFFPETLRSVGSYLPTTFLHKNILTLLYGNTSFFVLPLFFYFVLFFLLSFLVLFFQSVKHREKN